MLGLFGWMQRPGRRRGPFRILGLLNSRILEFCPLGFSYHGSDMLMIRLARFGAKKKPSYRLVVIEKTRARDSRAVEVVGFYNPVSQPQVVSLKHDRIGHWLKQGAQPSDTVNRLLKNHPAQAPDAVPAAAPVA
jgi:small subunit ribosomal protein S16